MPLNFDLSLEQLQSYQGTNPRPADFDEFWTKSLAELDETEPRVEITPAEFSTPFARCEHLEFTGVGGVRVHAKLARPLEDTEGPAVLFFHGYNGRSTPWTELLAYVARGQTAVAMDLRGQGWDAPATGWAVSTQLLLGLEEGADRLHMRHAFLDTVRLARTVMDLPGVDPDRVATTGHSQGGALSLACAALEPRIALVAAVFPFLSDYQRAWELALGEAPYNEITNWFRKRDPQHQRREEIFTRLGYIDIQHLAPRVRARVDWTVALEDVVCPPSTQYAAYNKLTCAKSMRTYPDFGHEDLPGIEDALYTVLHPL
ncbi:alpha/beta fold hydrolase [Amycolatopsis magusensis]|uniref:alpha/beta fold hydrolase n=1 Tax=Amycolatopsis magusensis TaxID=882444 RepID=UPI003C30B25A